MAGFVLPIISGLAGLFGSSPKQNTQNNTSDSNTSFNNNSTSTTTPELSDLQQLLSKVAGYGALNQYGKGSGDLIDSIRQGGIKSINAGTDIKSKAVSNILASRGQSYSPAAVGALSNPQSDRVSQYAQLDQSLPQIGYQIDQNNFQNLLSAFKALPTATTTTGSSSGNQTTHGTQSGTQLIGGGSPLAGFLGGAGAGLAAPQSGADNSVLSGILKSFGFGGDD